MERIWSKVGGGSLPLLMLHASCCESRDMDSVRPLVSHASRDTSLLVQCYRTFSWNMELPNPFPVSNARIMGPNKDLYGSAQGFCPNKSFGQRLGQGA